MKILHKMIEDGPLMVAEIGANHDGDPEKAHLLVDEMADAGADAVKFQIYTADQLVADYERIVEWGPPGNRKSEEVGRMFDRIALPREAYADLFAHCRERGIEPFATVFDPADIEFVLKLSQRLFKISSGDINYKNLLVAVAETGMPVIISGGKCTLGEFIRAIDILEKGGGELCVMHCVAAYPTPIEQANLKVLQVYAALFHEAIRGFSDHTLGTTCALGAIALGASIIEKHVTYDKDAIGPDHWFSATAEEFAELADQCRTLYKALGSSLKKIWPCETTGALFGRRSVVAACDLPVEHRMTINDLAFLRPGSGIDPFDADIFIGAICKQKITKNTLLSLDLFDFTQE